MNVPDNVPDIAFITGAGWKPFNEGCSKNPEITPHRMPELLWPLGGRVTVLSRIVQQLRAAGINDITVGVGKPGSPTQGVEDKHYRIHEISVGDYGKPVWTEKRIRYIKSLGVKPVLTHDPHKPGTTCWDTLQVILEQATLWKRAIVLAGDYVFSTSFLHEKIAEAVYPSQIWLWPKHSMEFLDRPGAEALTQYLRELGTGHQGKVYGSRGLLARKGFTMIDMPAPPKTQRKARRAAFNKLCEGWFEIGPKVQKMYTFVAKNPIKGE